MTSRQKVSVNAPFDFSRGKFEVIKELAKIEDIPLGEWIMWCVIKMAEMDLDTGGPDHNIGKSDCNRMKKKWGRISD